MRDYQVVIGETQHCINHYYRKAVMHTGHVHMNKNETVLAGWCEYCKKYMDTRGSKDNQVKRCKGCFGKWKLEHGLVKR